MRICWILFTRRKLVVLGRQVLYKKLCTISSFLVAITETMSLSAKKFREVFKISKDLMNWYPGHMKASLTHMQAKMRMIDCVIEVHDARIPFSGRNPEFLKNVVGPKPRLLVLTKKDLIDKSNYLDIDDKFLENGENVVYANCLNQKCSGLKKLIPIMVDLIKDSPHQPAEGAKKYKLLVIGIPNVGKSSLINALRNISLHKGKATAVGGKPGVTRSIQNEIKISEDPLIYMIDTPGILMPKILNTECGMKLALCSCIKDEIVGIVTIADFLLYWMNKTRNFVYLEPFGLKEPTDNIMALLIKIAIDNNKLTKKKNIVNNSIETIPDINFSAHNMVSLFRKGKLGDLCLDSEFL